MSWVANKQFGTFVRELEMSPRRIRRYSSLAAERHIRGTNTMSAQKNTG